MYLPLSQLACTMAPASCNELTERRRKCHQVYGKSGEDCLVDELEEKRCLSFQHCPKQATAYYGTVDGRKGLCASWAEAFCFADDRINLMNDKDVEHHVKAQTIVNGNRDVKKECRSIAMDLAKCMKSYTHS